MKYELLKRTAIALFVGGIVSSYTVAADNSLDTATTNFTKAIKDEVKKQTDILKAEQDKKVEEISSDLTGVATDLVGVSANSYNNTLTLNGFKAGDDLYDIDPETGKVTKKTATEEDVKNDPLEGKGVLATVIKNKDSLDDLNEDFAETNAKVEEIGKAVKENRELLDKSNTAFGKLDESVSNLEDTINGDDGLVDKVVTHNKVIYGDGNPDSGLINVVNKQTEAIAKLEARDTYNHLDKVEDLVKDKAEKADLEKVNAGLNSVNRDVEGNIQAIRVNKANIEKKASKVYVDQELDKKANSADVTAKLSKKADQTDVDANKVEIAKKANSSDVYTKDEANNRFVQIENNVGNNVTSINKNRTSVTTNASNIERHNVRLNTLDSRVDKLDNRVNKLDKDLKRGLAAQAALTGLFQPYTVGKVNFTAAVGGYKSQTAVAVGTGYRYNQNIATKAGVAFTQGGVTYNAGVNFEW